MIPFRACTSRITLPFSNAIESTVMCGRTLSMKRKPKKKIPSKDAGTQNTDLIEQIESDVKGLEKLSAMQLNLIQEIRKQLDRVSRSRA